MKEDWLDRQVAKYLKMVINSPKENTWANFREFGINYFLRTWLFPIWLMRGLIALKKVKVETVSKNEKSTK